MKDNGTDRDVALLILSGLDSCSTLVATINDNLYVPHIITQPTNQQGALGDTITITVVANNVAGYQWQYKTAASGAIWRDSSYEGNQTDTLTFELIQARVGYSFRCIITGKDGSTLTTNTVTVTLTPEPEG